MHSEHSTAGCNLRKRPSWPPATPGEVGFAETWEKFGLNEKCSKDGTLLVYSGSEKETLLSLSMSSVVKSLRLLKMFGINFEYPYTMKIGKLHLRGVRKHSLKKTWKHLQNQGLRDFPGGYYIVIMKLKLNNERPWVTAAIFTAREFVFRHLVAKHQRLLLSPRCCCRPGIFGARKNMLHLEDRGTFTLWFINPFYKAALHPF